MNTVNRKRQPKGIPIGGEFARGTTGESEVGLDNNPWSEDRFVEMSPEEREKNRLDLWVSRVDVIEYELKSLREASDKNSASIQEYNDVLRGMELDSGGLGQIRYDLKERLRKEREAAYISKEMKDARNAAEQILLEAGARPFVAKHLSRSVSLDGKIPTSGEYQNNPVTLPAGVKNNLDNIIESRSMPEQCSLLDNLSKKNGTLVDEIKEMEQRISSLEEKVSSNRERMSEVYTEYMKYVEAGKGPAERIAQLEAELEDMRWAYEMGVPTGGDFVTVSDLDEVPIGEDGGWNVWIVNGGRVVGAQQVNMGQRSAVALRDEYENLSYFGHKYSHSPGKPYESLVQSNHRLYVVDGVQNVKSPVKSGVIDTTD